MLDKLKGGVPDFRAEFEVLFDRPPHSIPLDHPFTSLVREVVGQHLGEPPILRGETFWTDCALLAQAAIPSLLWGPSGEGLHANKEWVGAKSVAQVAENLTSIAARFCQ